VTKSFVEQNHYEVLELSRGTTREEIESAYQLARATFAEDSLAGYSVFEDGDAEAISDRIETAYRVLSDEAARRAYDASLTPLESPAPAPLPEPTTAASPSVELVDFEEEFDEGAGAYDGARLRRSRLRRGLELVDIARVTKVNPIYLRFIEEDRFADLPARVYVRGFVSAYASCVGLDPRSVAAGYMQRFDEERSRGEPVFAKGD
jgi:curved DNA-binding protein CbpA